MNRPLAIRRGACYTIEERQPEDKTMNIFGFNPINELRNRVSRLVWIGIICVGLLILLFIKQWL